MVKLGDVVEITLSDGRKAYAQYVFLDKMGPLIQVFGLITSEKIRIEDLKDSGPLFPPVITGLMAAVHTGLWKVVGHLSVDEFEYPGFISTFEDEKTGSARMWFFWDGKRSVRIGPKLPDKYKNLEYLVVWSPYDVMTRIETGVIPYPYGDLIQFNRYTPRNDTTRKI